MTQEQKMEKPRFFKDEEEPILPGKDDQEDQEGQSRSLFVQDEDDEDDEKERFCSCLQDLVGENSVSASQLLSLWQKYGRVENGISIAANKYFEEMEASERSKNNDGSGDSVPIVIDLSDEDDDGDDELSVVSSSQVVSSKRTSSQAGFYSSEKDARMKEDTQAEWVRYVGTIYTTGFATRPTVKPVPVGSHLGFKKTVPKTLPLVSKSSSSQHCSHLVRLMDLAQNRELGRIPEEIARIVYPLLDYRSEIRLEPYLLDNNGKRFSVGDDIYIRIECYLTSNIFTKAEEGAASIRSSLSNRTMDMSQLHRSEAIMALFDAINIKPVYGDTSKREIESIETQPKELPDSESDGSGFSATQFQEEAMNINQLKSFYRITQSADSLQKLPETTPDDTVFNFRLRRYQKQSLSWMLKREYEYKHLSKEAAEMSIDGNSMNPLWKKFSWPNNQISKHNDHDDDDDEGEKFFYANLYTGEFSTVKPVIKAMVNGGILADEMGLGKTISALALICTASYDEEFSIKLATTKSLSIKDMATKEASPTFFSQQTGKLSLSQQKNGNYAYKTTLIIVPMSLLNQWQTEFEKANNDSSKRCEIYYGSNIKDIKSYVLGPNPPSVIITTYGVIQSEYGRGRDSSNIFDVVFFRIILDEGHTIRNRMTRTSKAVIALRSSRKWILTGTPIINRLNDLFSLVQFLNLEPWSHINYWNRYISVPFEKGKYEQAFDVINAVLEPVLLRRTKNMKDIDGEPLVSLPPKEVVVEKFDLSPVENRVYQSLLKDAENSVKEGLAKGDLLKNYTNILVHILRLRQVCCHLDLVKEAPKEENDEGDLEKLDETSTPNITAMLALEKDSTSNKRMSSEKLTRLNNAFRENHKATTSAPDFECAICTTESIQPISAISVTECLHTFCEQCLAEYIDFQHNKKLPINCPYCREPISDTSILKLSEPIDTKKGYELVPFESHFQSTKIKALLKHLKQIQETCPGEQVIVFSQFSSFLDILERELGSHLPKDQVKIYKFDGRLDMKERTRLLEQFHTKDLSCIKLLLLSLKAGGVGLNLTCASRAFMMDPWWSPGMEDQAIDRIHRIGQQKTVKVVRFIVNNSVEEKMLRIQERKRLIGDVVDGDEEQRRKKRVEEIQMLFQ